MPSFNIIKKSNIENTFRVNKILNEFDVQIEHSNENFVGEINLEENWSIGLIVGASGTGKTTIAKHLFENIIIDKFEYKEKSVLDDMPKNINVDNIIKTFYSVGFSSVPSWLKPYNVLSNGEKMRVDLARAILEKDFIVFDEFTSVVDRNVAKNLSIALNKAIKLNNKKFIAISCHYDIVEYLEPDWIFDTNKMEFFFIKNKEQKKNILLENVKEPNGKFLASIII